MNAKTRAMMFATLGLAMIGSMDNNQGRQFDLEDVEPPKKVIPNGCAEYSFYGFTVIAISEKSARKKCKKLLDKSLNLS